jgi:hypothetical protein
MFWTIVFAMLFVTVILPLLCYAVILTIAGIFWFIMKCIEAINE